MEHFLNGHLACTCDDETSAKLFWKLTKGTGSTKLCWVDVFLCFCFQFLFLLNFTSLKNGPQICLCFLPLERYERPRRTLTEKGTHLQHISGYHESCAETSSLFNGGGKKTKSCGYPRVPGVTAGWMKMIPISI